MYAIQLNDGTLEWQEVADEPCGPGQVRIRVAATAINRADLVQRQGGYPPPPGASPILGLECAGEITEVGDGVSSWQIGQQVCALLAGGGYASEVVVPAGQVAAVPQGMDLHTAAAIPEVFATAYLNLYMEAALQPGERVVLHAGASGVGTAALQMLKETNNPTFVTASGDKLAQCRALGASGVHDRHADTSFLTAALAWAEPHGVDVILDPVGGRYLADNLSLLGTDGRLVLIGLMGGAATEINLGLLLMKRIRVIGSTLRARSIGAKARIMEALVRDVWPKFESGAIVPVIDKKYAIQQAEDAHAYVASDTTIGKVVLTID